MTCEDFRGQLHDYFDGKLSPEDRQGIDEHHPACPSCGELMTIALELTCREFTDFLNAYVDDELDPERRAVFERHLSICPDCTNYLQSYKAAMRMSVWSMRKVPGTGGEEVPPDLIRAVLEATRRR